MMLNPGSGNGAAVVVRGRPSLVEVNEGVGFRYWELFVQVAFALGD
jgi:hypothetical protein